MGQLFNTTIVYRTMPYARPWYDFLRKLFACRLITKRCVLHCFPDWLPGFPAELPHPNLWIIGLFILSALWRFTFFNWPFTLVNLIRNKSKIFSDTSSLKLIVDITLVMGY